MVSWREQPTRYDIEALQANVRRVGLVIRVRWTLLVVLVLYSLLAGFAYTGHMSTAELARFMVIPALALGFVVLYNSFYALNYRRLGNIAVWNNLQLGLDALVVTTLVYFSGGVNSWFWSVYALFILEAAFILPRSRDVWAHAAFTCALLSTVEWLQYFEVLPYRQIPFADVDLHTELTFVAVRWGWQMAVLIGTAWIAILLVGEFRRDLATRRSQSLVDETTGLYSRSYFMRACVAEVRRAQRDRRALHVLLLDIDQFGEYNARFSFDTGDQLLRQLGEAITESVSEAGDLASSTNILARFGGEEFVVLFAEDERFDGVPSIEAASSMAEQLRAVVERVTVNGAGVTVSIGVASMPDDGSTIEELLDQADAALVCAVERGGNTVVAARDCPPPGSDTGDEDPGV